MARSKIPQKFSRWSSLWDQWHEKLKVQGASPSAASLAYTPSLEQVDRVIVGVDGVKQLKAILKAEMMPEYSLDTSYMISNDIDLINLSHWYQL